MGIYLTNYQIRKLEKVSDKKDLYCGTRGACYKYKDGVLKIYYDLSSINFEAINNNIKKKSPIVLYPKKKLYIVSFTKFPFVPYGYYMDKAPGKNLLQLRNEIICNKSDLLFDDLLKIYYDNFLPLLKKEQDEFIDLKLAHIFLYDNFYLTDTDSFEKRENAYYYNLYKFNKIMASFFEFILPKTYIDGYLSYKDESYIDKQIKEIKKCTSNNVNSFQELNNYFK